MDLEQLVVLETDVWNALVDGDGGADGDALSEDFLGVYPTGFADRADHVGQLADGPTVASFRLCDARMLVVSDDAALLAYRAEYRRPGAATTEAMWVSSLWCRRAGRWARPREPLPPV